MKETEISEKLVYSFDYPSLDGNGFIDISKESIILSFPEKTTPYINDCLPIDQISQLWINNVQVMSTNWLPVYTMADHVRVNDILKKGAESFTYLTNGDIFHPHTFSWNPVKICSSSVYNFHRGDDFILYSYEDPKLTQIHLKIEEESNSYCEIEPNVQIYIGNNLVFCAQRDLSSIPQLSDVYFIIQYILYKLIR